MAAASTSSTASKLSLKLLVNKNTCKVLFAEAGKDFVDFLLSLLALPIGTIVQLLGARRMVGSLGKLHKSLSTLGNNYMQMGFDKDVLLNPRVALPRPSNYLLPDNAAVFLPTVSMVAKNYYHCSSCTSNVRLTETYGRTCPSGYNHQMTASPTILSDSKGENALAVASVATATEGGYVKGVVTYMVMDDLTVSPMSTISSITLLNKFHVNDVGALEERMVEIDMDKGLKLLEVSLYSTTVLTDVLLMKKGGR